MTAVGVVGSMVNRSMTQDDPQPYISDTGPPPDSSEVAIANLNVGVEYMRLGEYEKALAKLIRAKDARPDYAPTYNALGLLYQRMGQADQAEWNFKHALRLAEDDPATLNNYGQFLCAQNREAEAERHFLAAAENPFYDAPEIPYANLGTCAYRHGQTDKAIGHFEKALSLNPGVPAALIQLSEIHFNRGDYPAADQYLDRYLEYAEHTPRSLWLGIRIGRELGDQDAVSSYALLLRNKYPGSSEAQWLQESGIK